MRRQHKALLNQQRGLVVKAEDSNPPLKRPFFRHHSFGAKIGIVAYAVNSAKGRVDFEDGWLIKSSFLTKDKRIKSFYWITKLYKRSTTIFLLPFTRESHTTLISSAKSVPVH